jgi:hypothetical protein
LQIDPIVSLKGVVGYLEMPLQLKTLFRHLKKVGQT